MEQDKEDLKNMTAEDRIQKCYVRCQQHKNEIKRCNICWEKDFTTHNFGGNGAWKIFCDHATFSEIVTPTSRTIFQEPMYELRRSVEILPDYPCAPSFLSDSKKCHYETCPDDVREAPISRCSVFLSYCKKWLQALMDNQDYFMGTLRKEVGFNEAITAFMRVLHSARWHMDKEEKRAARELLIDNLIPEHKEHKTGLLPHYKILLPMRELLCNLAYHLSRKCKADYLEGEDLNNVAVLKELLTWAEENDLRIFNVAAECEKSVIQLIRTPAEYANSFMANHYHISIRTLKMSLKQSVANLTRLY